MSGLAKKTKTEVVEEITVAENNFLSIQKDVSQTAQEFSL